MCTKGSQTPEQRGRGVGVKVDRSRYQAGPGTKIWNFHRYYSGEKLAPVPTVFIGGNHEASNYLQELPYGGWVAPNIYFLGNTGVLRFGNLRIAGVSGIFKVSLSITVRQLGNYSIHYCLNFRINRIVIGSNCLVNARC